MTRRADLRDAAVSGGLGRVAVRRTCRDCRGAGTVADRDSGAGTGAGAGPESPPVSVPFTTAVPGTAVEIDPGARKTAEAVYRAEADR